MAAANLPNEPGAWDSDFSYAYLTRLYAVLKGNFALRLLSDVSTPADASGGRPSRRAFIRHDVDVCLERAVALARLEAELGVRSTFHVMIDSPFYEVTSANSRAALRELVRLGHEVGLHYDVVARGMQAADNGQREEDIGAACTELERLLDGAVTSFSFHKPVSELMNGPLRLAGRVNAAGRSLFQWYLSDSRGRWREGEPLNSLSVPRGPDLQILTHPIWWGPAHAHPSIRMRDFLLEIAPRLGRSYAELNDRMWGHIIYRGPDVPTER